LNSIKIVFNGYLVPLAAHINESRVTVVRDTPHPFFKRINVIFFDAVEYMNHDFTRQIFRVVPAA
jgi:hypothetical protein